MKMQSVDFLPEKIKAQRVRCTQWIRYAYVCTACLGVLFLLGYIRHSKIQSAKGELIAVRDRCDNLNRQLETRSKLERQFADLMLIKKIDDTLGSRVTALDVLAELNHLVPESIALVQFNLETMDVLLETKSVGSGGGSRAQAVTAGGLSSKKTVKRLRLIITGVAPTDVDVANFIGQLSVSPLFEEVSMGYTKTITFRGQNAREFQCSCYVIR